jgi:hypothetical protein
MNREYRSARLAVMLLVAMVSPVATPTLIWVTLAADLPLAVIVAEILILAALSNWSLQSALWACEFVVDGVEPTSAEPVSR